MTVLNRNDSARSNSLPPNDDYLEDYSRNDAVTSDIFLTKLSVDGSLETSKCSPSVSSSLATDDSGFGNLGGNRDISDLPSVSSGMSKDEFLVAMSEDLSDWLCKLYPDLCSGLNYENFFDVLSTGVIICHHAQILHKTLEEFKAADKNALRKFKTAGTFLTLPRSQPSYSSRNLPKIPATSNGLGSSALFVSRDNLSNFICWARDLGLSSCILFETEDLIGKKNLRNFIVCLMEIARIGGKFGFLIPEIIHLEAEIDGELIEDKSCCESSSKRQKILQPENPSSTVSQKPVKSCPENKRISINQASKYMNIHNKNSAAPAKPKVERPDFDLKSLDEIVREVLSKCTCEKMFPMIRLSEGRYRFGNKSQIIFVRILRRHVMVRVGGGWDTLNDFLNKHDECRRNKLNSTLTEPISPNENEDDKIPSANENDDKTKLNPTHSSKQPSPIRKTRSRSVTKNFVLDNKRISQKIIPSRTLQGSTSVCATRRYSEIRKAPTPRFTLRKKPENSSQTLVETKIPLPTMRFPVTKNS